MSRTVVPFAAPDMSALARSLKTQLAEHDGRPGHVELLNMLARGAGYRNFQHFRADAEAHDRLARPTAPAPEPPVDHKRVERVARLFDHERRLTRWPGKASDRELCLWAVWAQIPAGEVFTERQINDRLNALHLFGDHALLRRDLCDGGWMIRDPAGSAYRRVERRPPADAVTLIRHLPASA